MWNGRKEEWGMRGTKRKCKRLGSKIRKARREKREETNRLRDTG